MFGWLCGFEKKPKQIFLVHGEPEAKEEFAQYVKKNHDWDCEVVKGYDEYDLLAESIESGATAESDFASEAEIDNIRMRVSAMHSELENILYNTHLAVTSDISVGRIVELKNTIAELEKDIMDLGAAITKEDRNE